MHMDVKTIARLLLPASLGKPLAHPPEWRTAKVLSANVATRGKPRTSPKTLAHVWAASSCTQHHVPTAFRSRCPSSTRFT